MVKVNLKMVVIYSLCVCVCVFTVIYNNYLFSRLPEKNKTNDTLNKAGSQ